MRARWEENKKRARERERGRERERERYREEGGGGRRQKSYCLKYLSSIEFSYPGGPMRVALIVCSMIRLGIQIKGSSQFGSCVHNVSVDWR